MRLDFGLDKFSQISNVSRETVEDYQAWQKLLTRWNTKINLVAKASLPDFWERHALDSWQICQFLSKSSENKSETILDLGSGAGFPGIAAAIYCKHRGLGDVTLVESVGKKATFLRTVIRELNLPATVKAERIEDIAPIGADIVTARAFAPLERLLDYAAPHSHAGTRFCLLKGEAVESELEIARRRWTFTSKTVKSLTEEGGCVLLLSNIQPQAC